MIFLPLVVALAACGSREAPATSTAAKTAQTSAPSDASVPLVSGRHAFAIVPEQSKASYLANEEFFGSALRRLGMSAGKIQAVGTTQAIEGQFELDPERLTAPVGNNSFTVRMDTLKSNQAKRDAYIREVRDDGPSFDAYPLAIFKARAIDGGSSANGGGRELNLKLTGDMTIHGVTKPAVFDVKAQLAGDTLTGTATTRFRLSDFGIPKIDFYDTVTVADDIGIEVRFTARAVSR